MLKARYFGDKFKSHGIIIQKMSPKSFEKILYVFKRNGEFYFYLYLLYNILPADYQGSHSIFLHVWELYFWSFEPNAASNHQSVESKPHLNRLITKTWWSGTRTSKKLEIPKRYRICHSILTYMKFHYEHFFLIVTKL